MSRIHLCAGLFVCVTCIAAGDVVTLKTGKEVTCVVVGENAAEVSIDTSAGVLKVPRSTIQQIVKPTDPRVLQLQAAYAKQEYQAVAAALPSLVRSSVPQTDQATLALIESNTAQKLAQEKRKRDMEQAAVEQLKQQQRDQAQAQDVQERIKQYNKRDEQIRKNRRVVYEFDQTGASPSSGGFRGPSTSGSSRGGMIKIYHLYQLSEYRVARDQYEQHMNAMTEMSLGGLSSSARGVVIPVLVDDNGNVIGN